MIFWMSIYARLSLYGLFWLRSRKESSPRLSVSVNVKQPTTTVTQPATLSCLPNGHTLVVSGGLRVVELDRAGKIVQEIKDLTIRPWRERRGVGCGRPCATATSGC